MDTRTVTELFCVIAGVVSALLALVLTSLTGRRRWILAYMAFCFIAYGAFEYFGIIHFEAVR
jgi:hypothetical protein